MITDAGIAVPQDMVDALAGEKDALKAFEAMRPEDQRQFVDWLSKPGAQTRDQRLTELADHIRNHPASH